MNSSLIEKKQTRIFGFFAFIFFGTLCGLGIWKEKFLPTYLFGFLSVLGFGFIVAPTPLRPVYKDWLRFAHFINTVITNVILILIYYLVITPAGIIKRLFGGKPLPVKPDKNIPSYWVERTEPTQSSNRFFKRY